MADPTTSPKKNRQVDPEIAAIADCDRILSDLEALAADRVLVWLNNKHRLPAGRIGDVDTNDGRR